MRRSGRSDLQGARPPGRVAFTLLAREESPADAVLSSHAGPQARACLSRSTFTRTSSTMATRELRKRKQPDGCVFCEEQAKRRKKARPLPDAFKVSASRCRPPSHASQ